MTLPGHRRTSGLQRFGRDGPTAPVVAAELSKPSNTRRRSSGHLGPFDVGNSGKGVGQSRGVWNSSLRHVGLATPPASGRPGYIADDVICPQAAVPEIVSHYRQQGVLFVVE